MAIRRQASAGDVRMRPCTQLSRQYNVNQPVRTEPIDGFAVPAFPTARLRGVTKEGNAKNSGGRKRLHQNGMLRPGQVIFQVRPKGNQRYQEFSA